MAAASAIGPVPAVVAAGDAAGAGASSASAAHGATHGVLAVEHGQKEPRYNEQPKRLQKRTNLHRQDAHCQEAQHEEYDIFIITIARMPITKRLSMKNMILIITFVRMSMMRVTNESSLSSSASLLRASNFLQMCSKNRGRCLDPSQLGGYIV